MSPGEARQLGADRTRMFMWIGVTEAVPLIGIIAAFAHVIPYQVTIALFLVAAVVIWFIVSAYIKKMPPSTPPEIRRSTKMLRLAFSGACVLIPFVIYSIFNGGTGH